MTLSIGLIGYGALGRSAHQMLARTPGCRVSGILVPEPLTEETGLPVVHSLEGFLDIHHDVVVECAGQSALREYGHSLLMAGKDLVPASVGVFADDSFLSAMADSAKKGNATIRIPSGAMVGIDGLAAARLVGVDQVTYRGTMPPHALKNFESNGPIEQRTLAYEGTAREAVFKFPKNANLTATIALSSIGFDRTRVELYVDPAATSNIHELMASGDFGSFHVTVSGRRISETSPSSRIVAGSLVQAALGSNYTNLSVLLA